MAGIQLYVRFWSVPTRRDHRFGSPALKSQGRLKGTTEAVTGHRTPESMTSPFEQVLISSDVEQLEEADLSLLETLDHVLNKGLVIAGEIRISVADVDLIFVGLNVLVTSIETANEVLRERNVRELEKG